ncbi:hypothetical protein PHLGIDRAFT_242940 [Phlebiopsis gigantea 11061_1 CR5-6]|uniref:ABC transporter n=1 Tax=Phlebiopsis gigantea (strain 11061_1 CR5-6) TaxID=745531 RepID=A0A0C3S1W6_PHLG1|nr:hypothetical protein PHLGIDRAFT_242940 [Phlebiopsis gigantea 11061_1 CR5-6]
MDDAGRLQVVLTAAFHSGGDQKSVWLDERIVPFYVAGASLLSLLLQATWLSPPVQRLRGLHATKTAEPSKGFIHGVGGTTIFVFKFLRLDAALALLALLVYTAIRNGWTAVDTATVAALAYASVLAALNAFTPVKKNLEFSWHASLVSFALLAVYAYRDIWPLMTYTLEPKDGAEGSFLWVKFALTAVVGFLLPVFEPYPYVPYDPTKPMSVPSAEQTASIASFLTYIWIEPTIWDAYRVKHLAASQLPLLCDYDEAKNLIKRGYPRLDPFSGGPKKGNLFFGLVRVFRRSLLLQSGLLTIYSLANLAIPVGTNRLLTYLEHEGEGAFVRPWVWILWLGAGPLVQSVVWQLYIFLSTGSLVRTEAIVTSLVFDHALRIRLKAEVAEKKDAVPSAAPSPADATTPDSASAADAESDGAETDTVHSRTATTASSATAVASEAPAKDDQDKKKKDGAAAADKKKKDDAAAADKKSSNLVGKINNLVTSDLDSITSGRDFLFIVLSAPLMFALGMWFLYNVLGWSSFVGLAVMIVLLPVPTWVASLMQGVQKSKMKATDARVQGVTEVMSVLRMIKLFGWEHRVQETVAEKREVELGWIWKRKVLNLTNNCVNHTIPLVHMVVTFAVYTLVMKRDLTASIVFSSMTAFELMRSQMFRVMYMIPNMITANVSLGRVTDFLRNTELLDAFTETSAEETAIAAASAAHAGDALGFGRANFAWTREAETAEDGSATPSRQTFRLRVDGEVRFRRGGFNLVVGPTGAGKTSVLMALLGEMHYVPLGPDSWVSLPREGGVAYAAQESWVQNETIKENILFGAPYDEERYKKVIYQCGLTRDLSLFDAGDATEVGEKGLTLSGGQKARITLARAVYSSASTILLDDVLAALDVHTSRWIVNKCFKGDLIRGRTVLLVTHNVAMASPLADFVVSLADGHIVSQGSVSDALKQDDKLAEEYKHEEEALELEENEDIEATGSAEPEAPAPAKEGKLVVAEEIAIGHVSWRAFKLFLDGLSGNWPVFFWTQYFIGAGGSELFGVLETWWLGYWARQYSLMDSADVNVVFYLGVYCSLVGLVVLAHIYAVLVYTYASLRASRTIHSSLVRSLLGSTFRWLDVTPTSRVIARCTQDIQAIDGQVPMALDALFNITLSCFMKIGAVLIFTPVFLLPAVFIAALGGFLGSMYIKAQLAVKREMSNAKAPVLGVFGGAIAGLSSIRAYSAQEAFRDQLHERIDRYVRAARSFYNVNRWVSTRLDVLGQVFTASLTFYLVYGNVTRSASSVGFVLSMAVSFSELILWWVRIYNEFEVNGNSLERIQQYIEIEQEPQPKDTGNPPAYWPASGDLRVEKLTARYSSDGPKVLEDVSFHAQPGERVGIVGRTGSGKSTLTLAILRCIHTEGSVIFDGIPAHSLNLDSLRSNITIIPQVPELLSGSLRHNLDMFAQYDDAVLNDALRAAGLFSLQKLSDENRITLDTEIASGGGNLSVGQRQIIALARAIVRQSKLLILDEATSAIDYETDTVIQSSLRTELKSDVTVITVAHRLQTIMDYDKIMVLDAGRLVEYDAPKALLRKEGSLLRALVDESADKDALYAMAEDKA